MYPHRLRTTGSPRSDWANATAFFCDLPFCDDVGTARHLISHNVFGRHLISESLKGLDNTLFLKACTIMSSSLVCSFTICDPNRFKKSFNDSP